MSASTSAISTIDRIYAWAREERMRMTSRVPSDPRKAKAQEKQADVLLRIENYAGKIKGRLESDARVGSVAWQRARKKSFTVYDSAAPMGEAMIDRAMKLVRR